MFANLNHVKSIYHRLVLAYGLCEASAIHAALVKGEITREIRLKIRGITVAPAQSVTLH